MDLNEHPYFFWDYDITWKEIEEKLKGQDVSQKSWIVGRMLEYAKWEDIWRFLTVSEIKQLLPHLKMKPNIRKIWEYAIDYWSR